MYLSQDAKNQCYDQNCVKRSYTYILIIDQFIKIPTNDLLYKYGYVRYYLSEMIDVTK